MKNIIKTLFTLTAVMIMTAVCALAQITPSVYYTFDLANPLAPATGATNLNPTGAYTINSGGLVESYVTVNRAVNQALIGQQVSVTNQITVEFLWKPEYGWDENRDPILFSIGNVYALFKWPEIWWYTTTNGVEDNFRIDLQRYGRGSWSYYAKNWHHLVFSFNAASGSKQLFVDGFCPAGFNKGIAGGTITGGTAQAIYLGDNTSFRNGSFSFDEVAVYNQAMAANQVYKHYQDALSGNHYTLSTATPPATPSVTAPLDVLEFPIGYVLGSTTSSGVATSAYQQMRTFPRPRYRIGTDAPKNFNWMQLDYMGGNYQPDYTNAMMRDTSAAMNIELATNWNHYFLVNGNFNSTDYTDTTTWEGRMVAISNRNKQFKTGIISLYNQLNPRDFFPFWQNQDYFRSQNCPANNYINNGSGGFYQPNGSVGSFRYRSPASPLDSIKIDASTFRRKFQFLANAMTDTLDLINDNDEVLTYFDSTVLRQDPAIIAGMAGAGFGNANQYASFKFANMWEVIKDSIKSIPAFDSTGFTVYIIEGLDGSVAFQGGIVSRYLLSKYKEVNEDPVFGATTTFSFYPRYPWNWRYWTGAWVGLQPFYESRTVETNTNIKYTTPFVACGWNVNEELNMRPAQWLGILKVLGMTGSRMFYSGYFNEAFDYNPPNPPPANPKGYVWQAVMPAYAQSACDWVMDNTYGNDTLMAGDVPINYQSPVSAGWRFYSGSEEIQTIIRKRTGSEQYAIATAYVNSSNMSGATPLTDTAVFILAGKEIQLQTRRQGSVYCLDLNKDTAVIIQYDGWHQYEHPQRWSQDLYVEAEHYGKYISEEEDVRTIPYQSSASSNLSFFNTTTFLTWRDSASYSRDTLSYQVNIPSDTTLWLWVRARSLNGTSAGFSARMDNTGAFTQNNIVDTAFKWYRIDGSLDTMKWVTVADGFHTLKLYPTSARTEIDQFLLTNNRNTILPEGVPGTSDPCTTAFVPTVSPSGPVTQCGGTVVLLASAANNYVWSTGATTQSLTVSTSGSYTVTATNGAGCTGTSAAVVVTINPSISSSISSTADIYCGTNITLTSSPATSYLWSTGATTSTISVTSGTFTVTVTNASGCTASSSKVIAAGALPTASISPAGTTTQCGGTVVLTASPNTSYLWSTGAATQSITASSGTYTVTVTSATGCTATSAASTVDINTPITAIINPPSAQTCGGNVTLTATSATSYLWSTGATTQSISQGAGTYTVTVTSADGCTDDASATITTAAAATATITPNGSVSQCDGTVTLTSSAGSGYLWSNGATTSTINASTGTYRVTVTTVSGCTAVSAATVVTINASPTASITGSTAICQGSTSTLTASGGGTYLWSTGATTTSITTATAGTFTVTVTSSSGCTDTDNETVTVQVCNCVESDTLYPSQIGRFRAIVNWGAVPTATHYILTVTDQSDTTKTQTLTWGSNTTQVLVKFLTPSTTYKVTLAPYCGIADATESVMYFSTLRP